MALQILYQIDMTHGEVKEVLEDYWLDRAHAPSGDNDKLARDKLSFEDDKKDPEVRAFTEKLVLGTLDKKPDIDKMIERFAENWKIGRMAFVDRNILRLSAYEICFLEEIPIKVAINEAVELAKRYGEPDSSKFVNGILDKIAKSQ